MSLAIYKRDPGAKTTEAYASAEAAVQAVSHDDAVEADGLAWMPAQQRWQEDPPLADMPIGWLVHVAKTTTSGKVLDELSRSKDNFLRHAIAWNTATLYGVRFELEKDGLRLGDTLFGVAINNYTPIKTLVLLAKDADQKLRMKVARNTSTPEDTLLLLSMDANRQVRWSVAVNPMTPGKTLALLAKDAYEDVKKSAKDHPNYDPSLPVPRKP